MASPEQGTRGATRPAPGIWFPRAGGALSEVLTSPAQAEGSVAETLAKLLQVTQHWQRLSMDSGCRKTCCQGQRGASARADGEDALHSPRSQGPEGPGGTAQELTGLSCLPTPPNYQKLPGPWLLSHSGKAPTSLESAQAWSSGREQCSTEQSLSRGAGCGGQLGVPATQEKGYGRTSGERPGEGVAAEDQDGGLRSGNGRKEQRCWAALLGLSSVKESMFWITELPGNRPGVPVKG